MLQAMLAHLLRAVHPNDSFVIIVGIGDISSVESVELECVAWSARMRMKLLGV